MACELKITRQPVLPLMRRRLRYLPPMSGLKRKTHANEAEFYQLGQLTQFIHHESCIGIRIVIVC